MEGLRRWARRNPRRIGRLLILLGVVVAGWFTHQDDAASWQDYSVMTIERVAHPHKGKVEREYKLHTVTGPILDVAYPDLFNHALLLRQSLPAQLEVFAEHNIRGDTIAVEGLKLKSGEVLLDSEQVRARHRPERVFGMIVGVILVGIGFALQFRKIESATS